ncbi:MAG: 1,4-dihydroxy-2-naphthoate octaprenyltransferase [Candidatus Kapabacteria bacterium]|nr:1,4-dihydroxy-2-naphthoate octaprenyltransferase [Candidatus Kapabacteria bacterium]MDW8012993.1 1,4-dihydroxy-2-naphthoate octaprenyltransferase [Bacteroidota bacterium]
MDIQALRAAKQVFRENKALTLVTHGSDGLWAGKAYFGEQDGYLYVALEQGRNYRNVIENPRVFFVIERGVPDRFIQGEGIAEPLGPITERPERSIIFRKALELVLFAKLIPGVTLFRIRPTRLFVSDFTREWKPRAVVEVTDAVLDYFRNQLRDKPSKVAVFWKAVRSFSFTVTLAPVLLGSLVAPVFHWGLFLLTLLGTLLAHAGVNVISDYVDWRRGADTWKVLGSSRVLVDGLMQPQTHLRFGIILMVAAAIIGAILASLSGPAIWYLMAAGAAIGIFYTVPPIGLKYRALGDIAVFLAFGPLMALGAYYVQTSQLDWLPVWLSIPIGLLTIGILHGNNYRDIAEDRAAGYHTVASLLGPRGSAYYYAVLVVAAYVSLLLLVSLKLLPVWSLVALLTLPVGWRNIQVAFNHARVAFSFLDLLTAQLHLLFSLAVVAGLILQRLVPVVW